MPVSALSTPVVTVERLPLCHRTSGEICQSLNARAQDAVRNSGVRTTAERLTT